MNDEENPPYKIKLTACDQSFGSETFYWESFLSMLRGGYVRVNKTNILRR